MGAWGTGVFQDDDACDWVHELEQAKDATLLVRTLEAVVKSGEEYLEATKCSRALAAAEVVAALGGRATPNLPEECGEWVKLHRDLWATELSVLSPRAIERIRTNSELKELWEESEYAAEWHTVLSDLEGRLRATAT